MKHVYAILFHQNPDQLYRLIDRLNYENTFFVVHVCKNYKRYKELKSNLEVYDNVIFCKRERATWASYYIAKAHLNAIITALDEYGSFDTLTMLSGQTYPIKSNQYIFDYLSQYNGTDFIEYGKTSPVLNEDGKFWHPIKKQMTNRNLTIKYESYNIKIYKNFYLNLPWENEPGTKLKSRFKNGFKDFLRLVIPKRKFLDGYESYIGSNWFSLSFASCRFLADNYQKNRNYHHFMKYVFSACEMFFQTALLNSERKSSIANENLHCIVWEGGKRSPKLFETKDFDELAQAGPDKLFARKFDMSLDEKILDLIDEKLLLKKLPQKLEVL